MPKYFKIEKLLYICIPIIIGVNAGVVELVDPPERTARYGRAR